MKRLHVRALGWVVTRDICFEIVRVAFGGQRRMPRAALLELGARWQAVHTSRARDQAEPFGVLPFGQLTNSLSKQREKTLAEFVDSLQACRPDLYTEQALGQRCLRARGRAIVSLSLGAILANLTRSDVPIVGDSAVVLFAMACWSAVTTIQLWRTHLLVKRIRQVPRRHASVTQQSSAQPADAGLPDP
jgi:hypothetical protein